MKNTESKIYQAKTKLFIDRKLARRINKVINGGGWVQQVENIGQKLETATFEVCVYHQDLITAVEKIIGDGHNWDLRK